jgi:hypothetical protein
MVFEAELKVSYLEFLAIVVDVRIKPKYLILSNYLVLTI